jgi:hypothetical protein
LCNSNNGFRRRKARPEINRRAMRRDAFARTIHKPREKFRRQIKVAGRGLRDDGACA